jgi:predicted nucleic acid-binding protein
MKAVFADTFFWIAFTNTQDEAHEPVKSLPSAAEAALIKDHLWHC